MFRDLPELSSSIALVLALFCGCGAKTDLLLEAARDAAADSTAPDAGERTDDRRRLSMSWDHACAIVDRGRVRCWGYNALGLVGETDELRASPTEVPGLSDVVEVATGQLVSCALDGNGRVWCWGDVLGSRTPLEVTSLPPAERLFVGSATICIISAVGLVACTGQSFFSGGFCTPPVADTSLDGSWQPSVTDVVDLAIGQRHACAARSDGSVWCWGCEEMLELGSPGPRDHTDPVRVEGVSAVHLAAETNATCAWTDREDVWCWGDGSQFGVSLTILPVSPRQVSFGATPVDLDVGVVSTCSGVGDEVVCLGSTYDFPTCTNRWNGRVAFDLPEVREVSIGYMDMCARDAQGRVWCWGCNQTGAVGDGSTTGHAVPFEVPL